VSLPWTTPRRHADAAEESSEYEPRARKDEREAAGYDDRVTDDDTSQAAPSSPGERRLARPPSDRYRETEARAAAVLGDPAVSVARGVAVAAVVAIVGAVAIVILGGVLTITEGLLVVAGSTGGGSGIALRWGAGERLSRRRRVVIALALALAAVALGQLGLWQYARTEGGVLPLVDYLGEVYGPLVPLEFATAAAVGWLAAR
jgi:hypothetical protein